MPFWEWAPGHGLPDSACGRAPIHGLPESLTVSPIKKRLLTCLLAMYMPDQGVDENLESALECWNFYADQPTPPALPSGSGGRIETKFGGFVMRPGITLVE